MKKILSFIFIMVLALGLTTNVFAGKPDWAKKDKGLPPGLEKKEELPKGLRQKEELPFGLQKFVKEDITKEQMNELIDEVNEYILENEVEDLEIVEAINNLIERAEYEMLKEEPSLNKFYNNLEKKFEILKNQELEEINYLDELKELKLKLEDLESSEELDELINDINEYIEDGQVSEEKYNEFLDLADEFIDLEQKDQTIDELVIKVREFIAQNEYGNKIGNYSSEKVFELLKLVMAYDPADEQEKLDDLYDNISQSFKELKLTKIVGQDYIEELKDYKVILNDLSGDFTEEKLEKINNLIEDINNILLKEQTTLKKFYEIKDKYLEITEKSIDYKADLKDLINEAKGLLDEDYDEAIEEDRILFINRLAHIISKRQDYETEKEYEEAIDLLQGTIDDYKELLNQ